LKILQHEFTNLRDGNGLAPYLVDVAALVERAVLLPTENGEREISAGVECMLLVQAGDSLIDKAQRTNLRGIERP
jgi:hypothetical protein